jgi:hypothetical protein
MGRLRSAFNILSGLTFDTATGGRYKVACPPSSWVCSICGGGFSQSPNKQIVSHVCRGEGVPQGRTVRYVGVREHGRRVWGSMWGNRPKVVRGPSRASRFPNSN